MKEYYQARFYWMFHYTRKSLGYVLLKSLCVVVGAPIYAVSFVLEMLLTAVYALFAWIPVLNVVVGVVCKALISLVGATFYITVLPDLKEYLKTRAQEVEYEVHDVTDEANETADVEE